MDFEVNERPTASNKKKNTKKWCKGKPGREHDAVIEMDTRLFYGKTDKCYAWEYRVWTGYRRDIVVKTKWRCLHHEVCKNCGKELKYSVDCPDKPKDI